ncbi:hypothetical protein [Azospirillum sp. B2RO_4]|uniref:hypothetical protein n=1 Tax=Azospirillum sp. B2RO_4 TaxID=3027796 RepID=UPI003DA8EB93
MPISSNSELKDAINKGQDTISIEGDLAKKILKIKATGKVAWLVAIGAIGLSAYALISAPATAPVTGGANFAASAIGGGAAVSILGASTTAFAISLAVAAGGVGILKTLYSGYKVESNKNGVVVLKKIR